MPTSITLSSLSSVDDRIISRDDVYFPREVVPQTLTALRQNYRVLQINPELSHLHQEQKGVQVAKIFNKPFKGMTNGHGSMQ